MKKKAILRFSPKAEKTYSSLKQEIDNSKDAKTLAKAVEHKEGLIKENVFYGDHIKKDLIPKMYKEQYNITNLFRVELPLFWRMLYTLMDGNDSDTVIVIVMDILDHDEYNKLFGYRKQ